MPSLPPILTIPAVHALLQHLSVAELTEILLARAQESEAVFCTITATRARQAAKAADKRERRHALDGIPMSWKDLYDQAGEITRAASLTTAQDAAKSHDAHAVALLEGLGAIAIGRTNMTEFALSGLGLNPHFGTPANVWSQNEALAPGGSSSGAAISVANGTVAYAMGTDTSGSIRIPAALNGLAGFRPTSERLSRAGVWTLSPTLDSIGPLAHTVADICTVMQTFGVDADSADDAPLQLIVPQGVLTQDCDPAIAEDFAQTLSRLKDAGISIRTQTLPELEAPLALFGEYGTLVGIEAWLLHRDALVHTDIMDARVAKRLHDHSAYPPQNLCHLLAKRAAWQLSLAKTLQNAFILLPTTAIDAPPLKGLQNDDDFFMTQNRNILRNTMMGSFLDMPALTIPTGVKANGLPGALMIAGVRGRDEAVLNAGRQLARLLTGDTPLNERRN